MKKYYVQNGTIVINKYAVKYKTEQSSEKAETVSNTIQYFSDKKELSGLIAELKRKGIDFELINIEVEDILKYDGILVDSDEYARKIIEPTLDEVISDKIKEISEQCKNNIYNGIDVELNNGDIKHFSLKIEDQINLNSLINQISIGNIKAEEGVPYHADGEMVILFSIADFTIISKAASAFILQQTTYCNHLMNYIKSLKNIDEIRTVTYGQELKNNFLNSYNNILRGENLCL